MSLSTNITVHTHLSSSDSSSQFINQTHDQNKTTTDKIFVYEQNSQSTAKLDSLPPMNHSSVRRRIKRRMLNRPEHSNKAMSEEDEHDLSHEYSLLKRRSRARKRESAPLTIDHRSQTSTHLYFDEKFRSSIQLLRKRSASENDVRLCRYITDDSISFHDVHTRFHSIDSRPKTLNVNANTDHVNDTFDEKLNRISTNPIAIEQTFDTNQIHNESDSLLNSILSKSAPLDHTEVNALRLSQSDDSSGDFFSNGDFSPTSSYERSVEQ
jgi:hypothetical protein